MVKYIYLLMILFSITANADTDVLSGMLDFKNNPSKYFDNYTDRPNEIAINKDNIKQQAISKSYSDNTANELRNNFDKRPEYTFTANELTRSIKVITNSNDIVRGIANEYTDCKEVKRCTETLSETIKYCEASTTPKNYKCDRERIVDVTIPDKINKRVKVQLKVDSKWGGTFRYSLLKQDVTSTTGGTITKSQDAGIGDIGCDNFNFSLIEHGYAPDTFTHRVSIVVTIDNNCTDPAINIVIGQGHRDNNKWKTRGIYAIVDIGSQKAPVITDNLQGECPELNKRVENGICKIANDICISGPDTKIINGVAVSRDCWRYQTIYNCGLQFAMVNNCQGLETANCIQISSTCKDYKNGICVVQQKGYKCPIQKCSADTNIICGDSKIECLDGSCVEQAKNEGSDFNDSLSKISILDAAIKDKPEMFTEDSKFIFTGRVLSCRKTGYGFSDCCKDSGWGVDLGLVHCNSEEKELGESKEKKLVVYIGKNIHKTSELEPDRVDKRYCVFNSKIARIIQEQGRWGQLGINFGTGKYPDCSGLSPNMLAKLDMDKINLNEIVDEIAGQHQAYDNNELGKKLTTKIQNYYDKSKEVGYGT
ncbi:MAG: conjugal transfer protein TraN [Rickettsiaceae bacterium]|nr:conjugal transfer protein TraN [Rickettsiaceae bacterium]